MSRDTWNSHNWSSAQGRRVEIRPGKQLIQHHCFRCLRDFVEDPSAGERYAVHVSVFTFQRLPDAISDQWLAEPCPGAAPAFDSEVRSQLNESHVIKLRSVRSGQEPSS
jgi:hypothetical protein